MDKDYYKKYFTSDNKSGHKTRENYVKKNFPELYSEIIKYPLNNEDYKFNQKLYNYLYEIKEIPKCLTCGKEIKWRGVFTEGYKEYCNLKCGGKGTKRIDNIRKTVKEKYGVDSISQLDDVKTKIIKNNRKKHGVDHVFQTKKFQQKAKNTNKKKYGFEFPIKSKIIKEKIKENNLKKYGVENPSKLNSVKEKLRYTNLKKYGVDSVMKVDAIRKKLLDNKLYTFIEKNDINYDIKNIGNGEYLVINECNEHKEYVINKTLFYHRIKYGLQKICVHCNPVSKMSSIKEEEIKNYIKDELLINIDENKRNFLNNKELDIYIENKKIGIEFNGLYWHSNLYVDNNYHLNKTEECNTIGIKLLHIFEDEWVLKNNIVKSIIKNKLGLSDRKIYGRKTTIKEIDSNTARNFLDENHIQGAINSSVKVGLYYENELVSLMTFGKKRSAMGSKSEEGEYEMYRYCNKLNTNIIGGASKLFKFFIETYKPKKIVSYADRRYFDGELYEKLGFIFISSTKPNYWYFKKNTLIREHRYNYRKDKLVSEGYDKTKTESEIMSERGYLRIYDCGNLKFEYTP